VAEKLGGGENMPQRRNIAAENKAAAAWQSAEGEEKAYVISSRLAIGESSVKAS